MMSQRFYVYPLFFAVLMQVVPLLRRDRRWYAAQIVQLFFIVTAAAGACYFDEEFVWVVIAWSLFLVFIVAPRIVLRLAMRVVSTRSLADAARLWHWAGRLAWGELGRLYRAHAAVLQLWGNGNRFAAETLLDQISSRPLPEAWRSEVRMWRLTLLTISRDWQQAIAFYERTDSWSTLE